MAGAYLNTMKHLAVNAPSFSLVLVVTQNRAKIGIILDLDLQNEQKHSFK